MRKLIFTPTLFIAAIAALMPAAASARHHHVRHYYGHAHVRRCRHSSGTAGLVAGGAGGALVGHALIGGPVGIAAGAVGGAFGGRAIDRSMTAHRRCR